MYQPAHFCEDRHEVLHDLVRRHPLEPFMSNGTDGLVVNPVPFAFDAEASRPGTLRCHVARANLHWKELAISPDCLVVFQGAEDYLTPSRYEANRETGKVVPTSNYATVHAWTSAVSRAVVKDDAQRLERQIEALALIRECLRTGSSDVSDAPEPFTAAQIRGIVGIEIAISCVAGKCKVRQNRSKADRQGCARGLAEENRHEMASLDAGRGSIELQTKNQEPHQ